MERTHRTEAVDFRQREVGNLGQPIRGRAKGINTPTSLSFQPLIPIDQCFPLAKSDPMPEAKGACAGSSYKSASLGTKQCASGFRRANGKYSRHPHLSMFSLSHVLAFLCHHLCKYSVPEGSVYPSSPCPRQSHLGLDFKYDCYVNNFPVSISSSFLPSCFYWMCPN